MKSVILIYNLIFYGLNKVEGNCLGVNSSRSSRYLSPFGSGWAPLVPPPFPIFNHNLPCWCPLTQREQHNQENTHVPAEMLVSTYRSEGNRKQGCVRGVAINLAASYSYKSACDPTYEGTSGSYEGTHVPLTNPLTSLKCCKLHGHDRGACVRVNLEGPSISPYACQCQSLDDPCLNHVPCCADTYCDANTRTCRGHGSCVWEGGIFCGCKDGRFCRKCCHGIFCRSSETECYCRHDPGGVTQPAVPEALPRQPSPTDRAGFYC